MMQPVSSAAAAEAAGESGGVVKGFSWADAFARIESARLDTALMLHHDAITGTSRKHVVRDYLTRLDKAYDSLADVASQVASRLLGTPDAQPRLQYQPVRLDSVEHAGKAVPFVVCATECVLCLRGIGDTPLVLLVLAHTHTTTNQVHNALGWERVEVVRLAFDVHEETWPHVTVRGSP